MKKILILEDSQDRIQSFNYWLPHYLSDETVDIHIATSVREAQRLFLQYKPFDLILLDHDLDNRIFVDTSEFNTGSTFALWLTQRPAVDILDTQIIIHSMNPGGATNMYTTLTENTVGASINKIPYPALLTLLSSKN